MTEGEQANGGLLSHISLSSLTTDDHFFTEAIATLGRISKHLPWSSYRALVQQFLKLSTGQSTSELVITRTLLAILDNLHFSLEDLFPTEIDQEVEHEEVLAPEQVAKTQGSGLKVLEIVLRRLLPSLLKHLEKRDEMEDANRILITVGVTKVALYLPEGSRLVQVDKIYSLSRLNLSSFLLPVLAGRFLFWVSTTTTLTSKFTLNLPSDSETKVVRKAI